MGIKSWVKDRVWYCAFRVFLWASGEKEEDHTFAISEKEREDDIIHYQKTMRERRERKSNA